MSEALSDFEAAIVAFARGTDQLTELCVEVCAEGADAGGKRQWVPRSAVLALAEHIQRLSCLDAGEVIQAACMNGDLPDVCEAAIPFVVSQGQKAGSDRA